MSKEQDLLKYKIQVKFLSFEEIPQEYLEEYFINFLIPEYNEKSIFIFLIYDLRQNFLIEENLKKMNLEKLFNYIKNIIDKILVFDIYKNYFSLEEKTILYFNLFLSYIAFLNNSSNTNIEKINFLKDKLKIDINSNNPIIIYLQNQNLLEILRILNTTDFGFSNNLILINKIIAKIDENDSFLKLQNFNIHNFLKGE